ncbi:MAG: GspE/PulE family protein, partial [Methylophilus sp.]
HTNDAPSAITRLLDLGVPSYLIQSTLLGVMAQRLLRTLCPNCKTPYAMPEHEWHDLIKPWEMPPPANAHGKVGCMDCRNTGYRGRSGIYEMLSVTPEIRKLITPVADLAKIRTLAYKEGMQPLLINGAEKIAAGTTTIEELLKVAPPLED